MRLTLLPLLLTTALASSSESSSSSSSSSSPESSADPTPAGALHLAKWTDTTLTPYTRHCATSKTLTAQIYTLGEMYPALKDWAAQLKVFYNKQHYPGSWEGKDVHGEGRELLKMEVEGLPFGVREWLSKNPNQRHFSVQDDVVFFAPGAIYPILPLFVESPTSSEADQDLDCDALYTDLENYATEPRDGVVLGKVAHKKLGKNEVEFTVEAFQVRKAAEGAKDEL